MKIAATLALFSTILGANALDDLTCGSFGIYGQATYLKPTTGGTVYVQQIPADQTSLAGTVNSKSVCPTYEWGFELGALYQTRCDCFYAKLLGGWIKSTQTDLTRGRTLAQLPLFDQVNLDGRNFGSAKADLKTEYWYVDARSGHYFMRDCGLDIDGYLGVRYANLCDRTDVTIAGTANTATAQVIRQQQRSEFSGAGPTLGLGGQFCIWKGLGIGTEMGAMALIGTRKSRVNNVQTLAIVGVLRNEFQYDNCVSVIPALDMRAAVNWTMQWECIKGKIEAGYRLDHYFKALKLGISSANTTVLRDIGFAGPYIKLGIAY